MTDLNSTELGTKNEAMQQKLHFQEYKNVHHYVVGNFNMNKQNLFFQSKISELRNTLSWQSKTVSNHDHYIFTTYSCIICCSYLCKKRSLTDQIIMYFSFYNISFQLVISFLPCGVVFKTNTKGWILVKKNRFIKLFYKLSICFMLLLLL